jgi:hypothetical protein
MEHLSRSELEAELSWLLQSPSGEGRLELIVRRPAVGEREVLSDGVLDPLVGLVGDTWRTRGSSHTLDRGADPDCQITVINARLAALVAGYGREGFSGFPGDDRRALAGDQLFVDFDISKTNLPAGSRLRVGAAILEVSAHPHNGCIKFRERFGGEAVRFVNSSAGRQLRLRGLNARLIVGGPIHVGDPVAKVAADELAVPAPAVC